MLSILFSFWLYKEATRELSIGLRAPFSMVITDEIQDAMSPFGLDRDSFISTRAEEGKKRVISNLIVLNIVVLIGGGSASYWLARRTMHPVEEAMQAQNRFTADASHELRTPLAAMRLETEVALMTDKKLSKDTKALLASNLEEIDRMTKLSEDLLTLASGESAYETQKLNLQEITIKVLERMEPLIKLKNSIITTNLDKLWIAGRSEEIERVLTILIDNAIKYSLKKSTVTVTLMKHGDQARLIIKDTGVGIAEADIPHIFDRFYRANNARTESASNGYGLGLPIAQKIVHEHNGTINVKSKIGDSSSFIVQLPLAK